jgi:adenosylmethionine-8-amino-7-oxononanoate aminotransferase
MEVALKLAYEFARRKRGVKAPRSCHYKGAYHGDTIGAVSLGHIDMFPQAYNGLLFKSDSCARAVLLSMPAQPGETAARRRARVPQMQLGSASPKVEKRFSAQKQKGDSYAAFVVEPLIQGAAGMIPQPNGWLKRVNEIARSSGSLLIADEVMTGLRTHRRDRSRCIALRFAS